MPNIGFKFSAESRLKMRNSHLGVKRPFMIGNKWRVGKKDSIDTRKKKSECKLGNNWNVGKTTSQHQKDVAALRWKGEGNPRWKGGITPENSLIRMSAKTQNWRKRIFMRDDYLCQSCGERGCYLHVHHIEPFSKNIEKRFDDNNGITLCINCHHEIHLFSRKT